VIERGGIPKPLLLNPIQIHHKYVIGFGLKRQNCIDSPTPKSDFEFGLSIIIQSTKLDCNQDEQSNPSTPCQNPYHPFVFEPA